MKTIAIYGKSQTPFGFWRGSDCGEEAADQALDEEGLKRLSAFGVVQTGFM